MCDIYALIGSLCGGASIWTMTAIAYDRYNVIVKVRNGSLIVDKIIKNVYEILSFFIIL